MGCPEDASTVKRPAPIWERPRISTHCETKSTWARGGVGDVGGVRRRVCRGGWGGGGGCGCG